MSFADKTPEEIRDEMERRYAAGEAYAETVPADAARVREVARNVYQLATRPGGVGRALGRVLDVGCGQGGAVAYLPADAQIVGLELSETAVLTARTRYPDVDYRVGAIERATEMFEGESFDTIVAVESIEHWADVRAGLDAVKALLKPDGLFVLTTPNRDSLHCRVGRRLGISMPFVSDDHVYEFGFSELIQLLRTHGFDRRESLGACLAPYWALEDEFKHRVRKLTDYDEELVDVLATAGRALPHIAFVQCHACVKGEGRE